MGACLGSQEVDIDFNGEVNFDHFRIIRAIGRGSFGKVCIVEKIDTKEQYAMKYVNKHHCLRMKCGQNTLREQKILSSLDGECPFIVNLWFSFQDAEDLFFVVDYMAGGDLRFHLQEGPFNVNRTRFYMAEVGLALRYLHRNNIIHRDIKPDNLLLDARGHVHLTDFNVAYMKESESDKKPRSVAGTRPYMAPELLLGMKGNGYTPAVDWWSLGVTMYECLTLRQPFKIPRDTSPRALIDFFRNVTVSFPASLSAECIKATKAFLRVTVAKRVQTIDALKELEFFSDVDFDGLWDGSVTPPFVPLANHINCDPMHELEEMIVESQPLHKKKRRLKKRASQGGLQPPEKSKDLVTLEKYFFVFNREKGGIIVKDAGNDTGIALDGGDLDTLSSAQAVEESSGENSVLVSRQNSTAQARPEVGDASVAMNQQTSPSREPKENPLTEETSEAAEATTASTDQDGRLKSLALSPQQNLARSPLSDGDPSVDMSAGVGCTHSMETLGVFSLHSAETAGMEESKPLLMASPDIAAVDEVRDSAEDQKPKAEVRHSAEEDEEPKPEVRHSAEDQKPKPEVRQLAREDQEPRADVIHSAEEDEVPKVEVRHSAEEDQETKEPEQSMDCPKEPITSESTALLEAVDNIDKVPASLGMSSV